MMSGVAIAAYSDFVEIQKDIFIFPDTTVEKRNELLQLLEDTKIHRQ